MFVRLVFGCFGLVVQGYAKQPTVEVKKKVYPPLAKSGARLCVSAKPHVPDVYRVRRVLQFSV